MMRRHFISVVMGVGLMVLSLLVGGTDAPWLRAADLKNLPPAAAPAGGAGTASIPVAAPPAVPIYRYSAAGKSDPFKPFMETDPALKKKIEEEQKNRQVALKKLPISPLQQADIGHFRLVGIAGDQHRRVAIVEDGAAKKYYPLFIGTYIGLNGGRVAEILHDRVVVEEKAQKQSKKAQIKRIMVMLHQ